VRDRQRLDAHVGDVLERLAELTELVLGGRDRVSDEAEV